MGWGLFSDPPPKKSAAKPKRCQLCRKTPCDCRTNKLKPVRETVRVSKAGNPVTRQSKTVGVDSRGVEWCAVCSCRVMNGQCSNVTCSTRR